MNLRDKFIWNMLTGLAFIAVIWYGWELFNNNSRMKKLYMNYENEQVGTDEKLQGKVSSLENIYKYRSNNKFINNENPFDLTRALVGSESGGSKKLLCSSTIELVNGKYKANIKYKGRDFFANEGDKFDWGEILEINKYEVIYIKNGIKKSLGNTAFGARIN